MVYLVTGQPGNGKTLASVHFMIEALLGDPKAIVMTNVHLFDGQLAGYMRSKGMKEDLWDRLGKIPEENVPEFYTWTVPVNCNIEPREFHKTQIGNLVPRKVPTPVIFVIDEAHLYWPARNFQRTGTEVLSYVSQHRHLGDTIVLITQHPEQLDKAFRRLVDEWWVMRSHEKRRWLGIKGPKGMFTRYVYFNPPSLLAKAAEHKTFKIDLDLAACYDTTAGKRFGDKPGDTGQKKKGIPTYVGVGLVFAALFGIWWLAMQLPDMVARGVSSVTGAAAKGASDGLAMGEKVLAGGIMGDSKPVEAVAESAGPAEEMEWRDVAVPFEDIKIRNGKRVVIRGLRDERRLVPKKKLDGASVPVVDKPQLEQPKQVLANPNAKAYVRPYVVDFYGNRKLVAPPVGAVGSFDNASETGFGPDQDGSVPDGNGH